jgi:ABC-type transport system involved in multi-copper enzyme maturation permease subunit
MKSLFTIAINTFRETIRDKVLYNILLFAALIILLSISFGRWSVFARVQVMQDFGLATMSISGLLLSIFIGVAMLGKELTSKTIFVIATPPVSRTAIIIGKFLGLIMTLIINFSIMTLFFFIALKLIGGELSFKLLQAVFLTGVEMTVIVSVALLFSTITTPIISAILTIAFYIAGHFNDFVDIQIIESSNRLLAIVLTKLYYLLPNLEHFNIRTPVVYNLPLPQNYTIMATSYGLLYVALFLTASSIIFSKKDL